MPVPLATLTMEAIALTVDQWRKADLSAKEALDKIGKLAKVRKVLGLLKDVDAKTKK